MKNLLILLISFIPSSATYAQTLNLTLKQTPGTCSSNAQINATASGGVLTYSYRLSAGAAGIAYPTSWQVSGNFSGLKSGMYTVQVQDNTGTIFPKNITVTTSYVSLAITGVTTTPSHCPLSADGTVTMNAINGKTPYSYRLLQGAVEIKPAQSSNKFTSVVEGNYIAEVTDACGEIRAYAITIALNDYKWTDVKTHDNGFLNSGYGGGYPASPFDTTKLSDIYDGPILFTCDSIAFRIFNTLTYNGSDLPARAVYRRVYIKELSSGNIIWDNTFRPGEWPGGYTSPGVHLRINTNYRFYFDDLCNDVDSADRNYNYANTDYYVPGASAQKICGGYNMTIGRPSNWNTKNRYNSPYDTITIISSTFPGDTTIGNRFIENFSDRSLTGPLVIPGITAGNTYTIRINNTCTTYTKSIFVKAPPPLSANISATAGACKINTASLHLNIISFPNTPGKMVYRINSGPASFTDVNGNTFSISYPITDSSGYGNRIGIRNFPPGTYNIDFWDQCGNTVPTMNYTVTDADVLKLSGNITANQQCTGASSITYNNISNQQLNGTILLLKKNSSGVYAVQNSSPQFNSGTLPASYTFSALTDGDYRVILLALNATPLAAPLPANNCDTLFKQDMVLLYQIPVIDTAAGYVCTPGGSDGKITLFGKRGVKPYQFQLIDNSGNALTAYQTDSTFTNLYKGIYNFRIKDNCGNATIYSYQIDTLKNARIIPSTFCPSTGSPLTLITDTVYNASYSWIFTPRSGSASIIANKRILDIPSFSPAYFGTMTVTYILPGCTNAKSKSILLGECSIALPLNLLSFSARNTNNCKTDLFWSNSDEKNLKEFEVQQSADGNYWNNGAFITTVHNNEAGIHNYSYHLDKTNGGKTFYRLKITEADGNYKYSSISVLQSNCSAKQVVLYPNPVSDVLTISINGYSGNVRYKLYNVSGELVDEHALINGLNTMNVKNLPKSVYNMVLIDEKTGEYKNFKLIVRF